MVLRAFLPLGALVALAVAQPLYDLLGRNPEFFVARRAGALDVAILVAGVSFLLPALLACTVGLAARIAPRLGDALLYAFVALLAGLLAVQGLDALFDAPGIRLVAGSVAIGLGAAFALSRSPALESGLRVLSAAILIVPGLLVCGAPLRQAVSGDAAQAALPPTSIDRSLVMIVFDGLALNALLDAEGEIDAVRFPNFAALARESTWYRRATTVSASTTQAVPALLTGRMPRARAVPNHRDHPENLFRLLGGTHVVHARETGTHLCPDAICARALPGFGSRVRLLFLDAAVVLGHALLPPDLALWLPPIGNKWVDFVQTESTPVDPPQAAVFDAWIDGLARSDRPRFDYLHAYLPHTPYTFLPSGRAYRRSWYESSGQGDQWGAWEADDEWAVAQSQQRYLLQTAFADTLLGRIVERLRALGTWDDGVVVVVADHGMSFRAGDARRAITKTNAHDIAAVPLFVRAAGQHGGRVSDLPVEGIDVAPTIVALLGAGIPWHTDGHSALAPDFPERTERTVYTGLKGRLHIPNRDLEPPDPGLARRIERFGVGPIDRVFAHGPYADLRGREVSALPRTHDPEIRIALEDPSVYAQVDPEARFVPAEITGLLDAPDRTARPLAVAIQGRVAATTWSHAATGAWSAIVPEDAFVAGANHVEAFLLRDVADGIELVSGEEADFLGVPLGGRFVPGVEETGFWPIQIQRGEATRYTMAEATLRAPLRAGGAPSALRLALAPSSGPPRELRVSLDDCTLFDGRVGPAAFERSFPAGQCRLAGDSVVVRLESEVFANPSAQPGSVEAMGRGVNVRALVLEP
jgi:hypothetical protein